MKTITRNRCNCGKPKNPDVIVKDEGEDTASEIKSK